MAMVSKVIFLVAAAAGLSAGEHTAPHPGQVAGGRKLRSATGQPRDLREELHQAVSEALGAGHDVDRGHLLATRERLLPMWRVLAKNSHDRIDRRSLRYVVHRYFLNRYGLSLVGLEPLQANTSHEEAALLAMHAPGYVRSVVEGRGAQTGFSIEDTAAMVAVLERLVVDSGRDTIEAVYRSQQRSERAPVKAKEMQPLMEAYLVRWMMGEDEESADVLDRNRTLVEETFENWRELQQFVSGQVRAFEHSRMSSSKQRFGSSWSPMKREFSVDDVQAVAGTITQSFGLFWEPECRRVKESLMRMEDGKGTGRVRLSDFHGAALNGEWRFSESREYLRELGALDETSAVHGPRVVIPNYMQAASNCIVSHRHYRVCCSNECEGYLSEIEDAIRAPTALPGEVLAVVENITTSLDDGRPKLTASLRSQLHQIAETNGGRIPLHGRLFSQWLHYVFPLECPFPHKAGTTVAMTPTEYGDKYFATEAEMAAHVELANATLATPQEKSSLLAEEEEEAAQITQFLHEEELVMDPVHLRAPWESQALSPLAVLLLASAVLGFCLFGGPRKGAGALSLLKGKDEGLPLAFGRSGKSHFV